MVSAAKAGRHQPARGFSLSAQASTVTLTFINVGLVAPIGRKQSGMHIKSLLLRPKSSSPMTEWQGSNHAYMDSPHKALVK